MVSEQIELLGKGVYTEIPDILNLKSIPTASELEYVGAEDFDKVMIEKILPSAVEEKINFYDLLEIDYYWVCRALRILNYGPYYTATSIFCTDCGSVSQGEYQVSLYTVDTIPLPEGFKNEVVISKDEFITFGKDIKLKLLTIKEVLAAYKDNAFKDGSGHVNRDLARLCYMIRAIGTNATVNPIEVLRIIKNEMSPADYRILKAVAASLTDYGLRASGIAQCPKCHSKKAKYLAFMDDKFFRPTLGDLKQWRTDCNSGKTKDGAGDKAKAV